VLQATNQNFIWTAERVYSHSTLRNLVRKIWLKCNLNRSESNVERCVPVRIKSSSTVDASKDRVFPILFINHMADWALLRSMSWTNFDYLYGFSDADVVQSRKEFGIRYPANQSVELPTFIMTSQVPYIFDRNHSVELLGYSDNIPSNLFASCLDEITLFALQSSEIFSVIGTLELSSSYDILSLSDSDISPEVKLSQDFLLCRIIHCYGRKVHRTNIDTHYGVLINRFWKIFFENNLDLVFNNDNSFEIPTIFKKIVKPLINTIFFDGNDNFSILKDRESYTKSASICEENFEASILELGRNPDKSILNFLSSTPNFPSASLNKLREEFSLISQSVISKIMQLFLSKGVVLLEN